MKQSIPHDTIIQGDCVDVMKSFPDDAIDLCITSPPYDDLREYNGFRFDIDAVTPELYRIMKPGGVVVWIVGDGTKNRARTGTSFRHFISFMEIGFSAHDWMIYRKTGIRYPDRSRYYNAFEFMGVFCKSYPKTINQIADRKNKTAGSKERYNYRKKDGTLINKNKIVETKANGVRTNVWDYSTSSTSNAPDRIAFNHPAIMPLELAADHVVSWSKQGDTVLDICCGSGQVPIAAMIRDRRYIGIDCSIEYIELAKRRLSLYRSELDNDTLEAIIKLDELRCRRDSVA